MRNRIVFFSLTLFLISSSVYASSKLDSVFLLPLDSNIWVHTTYSLIDGYEFPSNGLIVKTDSGFVLLDTPWNDDQTKSLIEKLEKKLHAPVVLTIITHAHNDRMGGIRYLKDHHIRVISSRETSELIVSQGYPASEITDLSDTTLVIGNLFFQIYYPGKGHTSDNIVIYLPHLKLLYAACFVKSKGSENLGNVADASVCDWGVSLKAVEDKFREFRIVVPGHGKCGDQFLIDHTLELIDAACIGE